MIRSKYFVVGCLLLALGVSATFAQWQRGRRQRSEYRYSDPRGGAPDWENDQKFSEDVFTFVRIRYASYGRGGYGRYGGRGGQWATDYPDSDLNFSFRLHQLTALEVNPDGLILELTDERLFDYPFIYICEPGNLVFFEEEVDNLRRYLLNGGFLMVDDFWGEYEWENFYEQFRRVFPNRPMHELPFEHPIFHAVFELEERPQIPAISQALRGRSYGRTWERSDARQVHYKAVYDDQDRMMAIICHNTDLGDGWEREGEDEWYFHEFSEKKAYPLGINIVFYAMTH